MIPRTKIENKSRTILSALKSRRDDPSHRLKEALSGRFELPLPLLTSCASAGFYFLLKALPGRKIYLPAYTCRALVEACVFADRLADLRLIDIELNTYGMDVNELEKQVEKGSLIVATHQFGIPAPIRRFVDIAKRAESILVEDNAAAFGAKFRGELTGRFGDVSLFSFDYSKTFSACGGGAVFFKNPALQKEVEQVQRQEADASFAHGWASLMRGLLYNLAAQNTVYRYFSFPTWRLRNGYYQDRGQLRPEKKAFYARPFTDAQARLALGQLSTIDRILESRKDIEHRYLRCLSGHPFLKSYRPLEDTETALLFFPIRIMRGDKLEFYKKCAAEGVDLGFTFSYVNKWDANAEFSMAQEAADQVLNLPFYSKLTNMEVMKICDVVNQNE